MRRGRDPARPTAHRVCVFVGHASDCLIKQPGMEDDDKDDDEVVSEPASPLMRPPGRVDFMTR